MKFHMCWLKDLVINPLEITFANNILLELEKTTYPYMNVVMPINDYTNKYISKLTLS